MRWSMLLLGLLLMLTACGSTAAARTPARHIPAKPTFAAVTDACALATESEIGGIINATVQAHASKTQSLATCTYQASAQDYVQTNITIEPSVDAAQNDFTDQQEGATLQNVSGIGDAAFYDGDETLTVLQRNAIATVIVHVASIQQKLPPDKQIAQVIVPRLG